jgi:hypothetical protein
MPRIPRSEREVRTSGQPLPYSTGDGYEAVGKAVSGLGRSLAGLGGDINAMQIKAERERDELDMFETRKMLSEFGGEQDQKQYEHDTAISGTGRRAAHARARRVAPPALGLGSARGDAARSPERAAQSLPGRSSRTALRVDPEEFLSSRPSPCSSRPV